MFAMLRIHRLTQIRKEELGKRIERFRGGVYL